MSPQNSVEARQLVGFGFPPDEGAHLAQILLADPTLRWENLRISVRGCRPGLLISAFTHAFLRSVELARPDLLRHAREILWDTDYAFQAEHLERQCATYEAAALRPSGLGQPDAAAFLGALAEVAATNGRKALRVLLRELDELLLQGRIGACDDILRAAQPAELGVLCSTGLAAFTLAERDHLQHRGAFVLRLQSWLRTTRPHDEEALLVGLQ